MSELAIRVDGLGKQYQLGSSGSGRYRYKSLRDSISNAVSAPLRKIASLGSQRRSESVSSKDARTLWALRDVSFEVKRGEVVGIIGRNGAGKSTLLKILSRITEPTTGFAEIHGRIGSLLEVGSGFHPELTGRENVYLNGAVLGMKKEEIRRKFDEIVAFAEIEKFLDTPVKRYSSGMYMRLAFSVAAHLEPEVLVVDEVLAVGDAAFQKKCLGKMQDVARQSRTILFVSHNMPAVVNLCDRAVVLDAGGIITDGEVSKGVESYLSTSANAAAVALDKRTDRKGNRALRFEGSRLENAACEPVAHGTSGEDLGFVLSYRCPGKSPIKDVHVAIAVHGRFDEELFYLATSTAGTDFEELPSKGEIRCVMPRVPLQPGRYTMNVFCTVQGEVADWIQGCCAFDVEGGDFFGTGRLPVAGRGPLLVSHCWQAGSRI